MSNTPQYSFLYLSIQHQNLFATVILLFTISYHGSTKLISKIPQSFKVTFQVFLGIIGAAQITFSVETLLVPGSAEKKSTGDVIQKDARKKAAVCRPVIYQNGTSLNTTLKRKRAYWVRTRINFFRKMKNVHVEIFNIHHTFKVPRKLIVSLPQLDPCLSCDLSRSLILQHKLKCYEKLLIAKVWK